MLLKYRKGINTCVFVKEIVFQIISVFVRLLGIHKQSGKNSVIKVFVFYYLRKQMSSYRELFFFRVTGFLTNQYQIELAF